MLQRVGEITKTESGRSNHRRQLIIGVCAHSSYKLSRAEVRHIEVLKV